MEDKKVYLIFANIKEKVICLFLFNNLQGDF